MVSIYGTYYNHLEEWLSGQRMLATPSESLDGWCGDLSIYMDNEFTMDAHDTSTGSLLRELLSPLPCPCPSTSSVKWKNKLCKVWFQDTPLDSIHTWHLSSTGCKCQPRDMLNQFKWKFTPILLEGSVISTPSNWAISLLTTWFWKDGEHLLMCITCLHVHYVPHCAKTPIWSMYTEILI